MRLDAGRPVSDLLADGYQFAVTFLQPDGLRFTIRQALGRPGRELSGPARHDQTWVERGAGGARIAAGAIMEAALPLSDLRVTAGAPLSFTVAVVRPGAQRGRAATGQPAGGADGPRRTVRSAQLERVTHRLRRAARVSHPPAARSRNRRLTTALRPPAEVSADGLQRGRRTRLLSDGVAG